MAHNSGSTPSFDDGTDISDLLNGDAGKLLHDYAGVCREEMEDHVRAIVSY